MSLRQPKPVVFKGLRRTSQAPPVLFEISCACGASIRGERQAQAQTVSCPSCGAKRIVLPRSPLPELVVSLDVLEDGPKGGTPFAILVIAAVLGVAILGGIGIWHWVSGKPNSEIPVLSDEEQYDRHVNAGRAALAERSWHKAARELDAALQLHARVQVRDSKRELRQQQRQAAIVADLLTESLAEIGRHALGLPNEEWQQIFHERYAGRSFILDDVIHRDASEKLHYQYKFMLQNAEMRLDLGRVKLLSTPVLLNQPQRVLIGLRLAGIHKDSTGWVVEFDPDGGVWLTDETMLAGLSIPVDAELRELLKRQRKWLSD